jgi:hypothetical protein
MKKLNPTRIPGGLPCPANESAVPIILLEASKWNSPRSDSWFERLNRADMLEFDHKSSKIAICFRTFSWVFKSSWQMERELNRMYAELRNK